MSPRKRSPHPTAAELNILRVLWSLQELTVGRSLRDRITRLIDPASTVPQTPGLASFVIVAAAALFISAISVATRASGEVGSDKPAQETAQTDIHTIPDPDWDEYWEKRRNL